MATERAPMLMEDHAQTALDFLEASDQEFADGDRLQASEKLWGATSHALMAIAQQRGWADGSHYALRAAAERLADEYDDFRIELEFAHAEKFHRNFYHDNMADFEIDHDRPIVHDLVHRVLALL